VSDRRILLADDSPTIQKVVNLTFADEGIEVVCTSDGDSAYEMLSQFTPDVVLADVNMPGKTGYELCEALRQRDDTRDTPVILLVGSFEPFDEERALTVGANDYLTKPFQSIRQLVSTVSELIKSSDDRKSHFAESSAPVEFEGPVERREPADHDGENEDIDVLYRQSFHETVELPRNATPTYTDLTDTGMDDELIETQDAGSLSDHNEPLEAFSAADPDGLSLADTFDSGVDGSNPFDVAEDAARFENTAPQESQPAENDFDATQPLETSNFEPAQPEYSSPPQNEGPPPDDEQILTGLDAFQNHLPPAETHQSADSHEEIPMLPDPESNVLDLPPTQPDEPDAPSPTPTADLPSSTSPKPEFSDEVIEVLADRVAERIAQTLARHLAQQVVPEVMRLMENDEKKDS
jgi:CheY-like chemotaxis protein